MARSYVSTSGSGGHKHAAGHLATRTANVLGYDLNLAVKLELAAEAIVRNKTRHIHTGCAIDEAGGVKRYFLLMAGIGIDATVARTGPYRLETAHRQRRLLVAG